MPEPITNLATALKVRRRERRLSLRDLADQIGVSSNTLSRVERGHIPDLKTFQRVVDWLEMPADAFLERERSTPRAIARHLQADRRLSKEAAGKITELVEEMYHNLAGDQQAVAVHLRSAQMFTPQAGTLLGTILDEMQAKLVAGE